MKFTPKNIAIIMVIIIILAGLALIVTKNSSSNIMNNRKFDNFKKNNKTQSFSKIYGKDSNTFTVELRNNPDTLTPNEIEKKIDSFVEKNIINQKMSVSYVSAEVYEQNNATEFIYTLSMNDGRKLILKDGENNTVNTLSQQDAISKIIYEYCGKKDVCRDGIKKTDLEKYLVNLLTPAYMSSFLSYTEAHGTVYIIPLLKTNEYKFLGEVRVFVENK